MPAGVCPKLFADLRVADQEADRLGNFGRLDQSTQPCVRQDVLLDVSFAQHPDHRRVGEPRVYDGGMDPDGLVAVHEAERLDAAFGKTDGNSAGRCHCQRP